jgi:hypothetical protein
MFNYNEKNKKYYIGWDKIKWFFWPFESAFVKNKYLWNIDKNLVDEKKYPWYKFSFWLTKKRVFIIGLEWIENIFNI